MFRPLRRCSIASFCSGFFALLFAGYWLLNVCPGNASKFFQNLDKNLFTSLYFCDCSHCVTTDSDLEAVMHNIPWPPTSHDQWDFSILKRYAKDSRLNVIPAGSFSPFPPPPSFFFLFFPILAQMSHINFDQSWLCITCPHCDLCLLVFVGCHGEVEEESWEVHDC